MIKENSCSQIIIITRITAIGCLLGMALSYKLWLNERSFPVVPVFTLIPDLHHPFDYVLPVVAGILLSGIIIVRKSQILIISFLIIALILALSDLNRWQPWFYQYILMFFMLSFFNYRCDDTSHQITIVTTFKLIVSSVYFWSGLQKLNPNFLSDTFPWLMEPVINYLGSPLINKFNFLGYSFPLIESLTGICLLVPALQKAAAISAIMMHVFILFVLSPAGHNYNPVVWPWNIVMILMVFVLFYNESIAGLGQLRITIRNISSKIVIGLFVLAPLFNFFNLWDSYLSHNLYSGNTSNGYIYFSDATKSVLPEYIQRYAIRESEENIVNIKYWCMMELGVPAYPEKRNFEAVTQTIYRYTKDSSSVYLRYDPKLRLKDL